MGLAVPRPAMRARERRTIEANLRLHAAAMKELQAAGMSRDEASRAALILVRAKKSLKPKPRTRKVKPHAAHHTKVHA